MIGSVSGIRHSAEHAVSLIHGSLTRIRYERLFRVHYYGSVRFNSYSFCSLTRISKSRLTLNSELQ